MDSPRLGSKALGIYLTTWIFFAGIYWKSGDDISVLEVYPFVFAGLAVVAVGLFNYSKLASVFRASRSDGMHASKMFGLYLGAGIGSFVWAYFRCLSGISLLSGVVLLLLVVVALVSGRLYDSVIWRNPGDSAEKPTS